MKCLVHNCENHAKEGGGRYLETYQGGELTLVFCCMPCWTFITEMSAGSEKSQIARNVKESLILEIKDKFQDKLIKFTEEVNRVFERGN
jgi:hypothetical protein